jgi:nicotinamidase-related amidase
MLDALAIHEAAHAVVDTVLGLPVHYTSIDPTTQNGRTQYVPALSKAIEELLHAPSLDQAMKTLAEKVGIAMAAGYVAEARHREVPRENICSTPDSPGISDREKMGFLCAKLQTQEQAQFAKWEDEAESLISGNAVVIKIVADELRRALCLSGQELQSLIAWLRQRQTTIMPCRDM